MFILSVLFSAECNNKQKKKKETQETSEEEKERKGTNHAWRTLYESGRGRGRRGWENPIISQGLAFKEEKKNEKKMKKVCKVFGEMNPAAGAYWTLHVRTPQPSWLLSWLYALQSIEKSVARRTIPDT